MSELRPASPTQRPENARPRSPAAPSSDGHDAPPEVDPPSPDELGRIQRHLVWLPAAEGATVTDEPALGVHLVAGFGSGPGHTFAAMPRWTADSWRASLAAVRDRMREDGMWPSLLLCDRLDRPLGLGPELEREGWGSVASETVMWVGHASVVPHLDPRLRIEAVLPRSVATHEALEREIFGIGESEAERRRLHLARALDEGSARAWVAWLDQEPVAVARLSQRDGTAALQGIGVASERRNQGFGTLITTIATRAGMAVGNRIIWLSVDADDAAAVRVYRKLGFAPLFTWTRWLLGGDPRTGA